MAWTEPEHVLSRWVGPNEPSVDDVAPLIEDAELVLQAEFPRLTERLAEGDEPNLEANVRFVVARMVIRSIRNPEGLRSIQDGAGPFQKTRTFGGDDPGDLWLTSHERALLAEPGSKRGKAFTVATDGHRATGPRHLDICSVWWGGDCSCGAVLLGGWGQ